MKKGSIYIAIGVSAAVIVFLLASVGTSPQVTENRIFFANSSLSCNCVAFRLDDVTDSKPGYLQFVVIDFFIERDIPLTIGIIGNQFGADQYTIDFLKNHLDNSTKNLEIANHGWNHENFKSFSLEEQDALIEKTNSRIFEKLGIMPEVFIPPYNEFDRNTLTALEKNHITHMSSIISLDEPSVTESMFYHLPTTSTSGEYNQDQEWTPWTGKKTFDYVKDSISKYGYAVVMMHPRDFGQFAKQGNAVSYEQLEELEFVINETKKAGFDIVPIGKIDLES